MSKWPQGPHDVQTVLQGANSPQAPQAAQTVPGLGKRCGAELDKWGQMVPVCSRWSPHTHGPATVNTSRTWLTTMALLRQPPFTWAEVLLGPIVPVTLVPKADFQQLQRLPWALVQVIEGARYIDP